MANDFQHGKLSKIIIAQAIPLILAQLVQLTYNIVDRIYIGHLPGDDGLALAGVGLAFPLITLIAAFTNLVCTGGAPLFAIARGGGEDEKASRILGNAAALLAGISAAVMAASYGFHRPILYLFGASDQSYGYARDYLMIYLIGTPFSMLSTGLNSFINAEGFPKVGMMTMVLGAVTNLILDPLFIYGFSMGIQGAAAATVISQAVSAAWVLRFLTGRKTLYRITRPDLRLDSGICGRMLTLGLSGFVFQATNCVVQIICNNMLQSWGGDLYVNVMTVLNSVREVVTLPVHGLTNGAQPVLGYNYGAKEYGRVREGIRFVTLGGLLITGVCWLLIVLFPGQIAGVFSNNAEILAVTPPAIRLYFMGFCFMALQMAGQTTFQGLGYSRHAIFFSLLRKVIIVVPLTLLLPGMGWGVNGVFLAEPISNAIGGIASYTAMYLVIVRRLKPSDK